MRKIVKPIRWLFEKVPDFTLFLSGFLIPVFLKSISQMTKPSAYVFSIALPVLVALAVSALISLRTQISREVDRSHLAVRFYPKSPEAEGDAEIYDPIIDRIQGAKRSVKILGSLRDPNARSSSARQRYFKEIENVIQKRVNGSKDFVYERLIQVARRDFDGNVSYQEMTALRSTAVDSFTFDHCRRVQEMTEGSGKVQVFFRQTPPVMPMVTLILVDDNYVILCLPWLEKNGVNELDTQQLGKGFFFHDFGGDLCSEMSAMFNIAKHYSPPVYKFDDDKGSSKEV